MFQHEKCAREAKELVSKMTLSEKISQLTYISPAIERLGIPAYNWWNEGLHGIARAGTATSFPQAIAMAAMFDRQLMTEVGEIIATEGRAKYNESIKHNDRDIYKGLTLWSPNINIFRDPRWGRGQETYGEDPYLTGELGTAFVRGIQGNGDTMKAAACAKHFAVHSGPENLRHSFNAVVSEKDLWETYLPAFEKLVIEAEVECVMGAYNRTNGEPCCGSTLLLRDILREKWKFKGHVVSDCWAIKDFHLNHQVTEGPEESSALAMNAGCDLNCGDTYIHLNKALKKGLISEEQITQAAERLFTTRYKLGLFSGSEYDEIPYEKVGCKEHTEKAIEVAQKSCVLLKNDGILPIDRKRTHTIGVIGPNADSRLALKGNYYGTSSRYITLLEGIQDEVENDCRILFAKGCELTKDRTEPLALAHDRLAEALTVAEHSDLVVLCLGLDETIEGEERDEGNNCGSGDKADLELPLVQKQLLESVIQVGKPVILCLMAGSSINLSYAQDHCAAILLTWYPGGRGGKAVAKILFGTVSPSGKLPVTFYRTLEGLGDFSDYSMKNRTYRYYQGEPLYPFGFGLTYGNVFCTDVEMISSPDRQDGLDLKVSVQNDSPIATEDVIEIYIKDHESSHAAANTSLCAFQRIYLKGWEKTNLSLHIPASAFSIVDDYGKRRIDSRQFSFYAGTSQPDERSKFLTKISPVEIKVQI